MAPEIKTPLEEEEEDELLPKKEQIRRAHEDRSKERRKTTKHRERQSHKEIEKEEQPHEVIAGRIVRAEGAFFVAQLDNGEEIRVRTIKNTKTDNPNATLVAVGDRVMIEQPEEGDAVIEEVLERKTKLSRRAAGRRDAFEQVVVSNVDVLVIITSAASPPFRSALVDRYIVAGLEGKLEIQIVINKFDLVKTKVDREYIESFIDLYNSLGYKSLGVSTVTHDGIEQLRENLKGKTSVFAGHSGVGKSSIVNALLGDEAGKTGVLKTGVLSKKYKRGAHTTTGSQLIPMKEMTSDGESTYIADTPGVREFANYDILPHNLKFYFAEFAAYQEGCEITNCSHVHEPGCAVQEAVENDEINVERYASYLKLFEEAETEEKRRRLEKY